MRESLIERELGRLSEGLENAKADRAEMTRVVSKLDDSVDAMRRALDGLAATSQAVANQIHSLATEKCGERLDRIETDRAREAAESKIRLEQFTTLLTVSADSKRRLDALDGERSHESENFRVVQKQADDCARTLATYRKVVGTGSGMVWRLALAIAASNIPAALIAKFWH